MPTCHPRSSSSSFAHLAQALARGENQLIWVSRIADTDTPVAAYLKLTSAEAFRDHPAFLLESVEGGERLGRYSFIGLAPDLLWQADQGRAFVNRTAQSAPEAFTPCPKPVLHSLRALVQASQIVLPEGLKTLLPQTIPTVVGYFGYESAGLVERLPRPRAKPLDVPDQCFMRPSILLIFDRLRDTLTILAPLYADQSLAVQDVHTQALAKLEQVQTLLDGPLPASSTNPAASMVSMTHTPMRANLDPEQYKAMVRQAQNYIAAGDIFQVVLAQRFSQAFLLEPFALYRALRRVNPSPFLYFLTLPDFSIVGSSPEILVRVRDCEITLRPIAGTRPRGQDALEDATLAQALLADPKECAEHLMLLDLGRNDVGRVAQPATVRIEEQFRIEKYSHVMHIVSEVRGKLAPGYDAVDAILAGFPAGTVSGAPKIRAMEIIHELETEARGLYAGGVGYFGADGSVDSCIVLRTALIKDGMMHVQAGAGIVAQSDPEAEQRECEAKAGALFAARHEAMLTYAAHTHETLHERQDL